VRLTQPTDDERDRPDYFAQADAIRRALDMPTEDDFLRIQRELRELFGISGDARPVEVRRRENSEYWERFYGIKT
jgi:hypothetical protein